MHRVLPFIFLSLFLSVVACEKVDQVLETADKVKTLKSDIEKTADQVKRDVTGKAEELKNRALKEASGLPYLNQKQQESGKDDKESGSGERDEKD